MSRSVRKRKSVKKLYAIKKGKTGKRSIIQVLNTSGKGKVYASNGKKIASSTKCFNTKSLAKKHLKSTYKTKRSSFGRKSSKKRSNEGYIACRDTDDNNKFKVYKAFKYKYDGETYKLFKVGSGEETKFYRITSDGVKFRKERTKASEDKKKYTDLGSAGIDLTAVQCDASMAGQISQGSIPGLSSELKRYSSMANKLGIPTNISLRRSLSKKSAKGVHPGSKDSLHEYFVKRLGANRVPSPFLGGSRPWETGSRNIQRPLRTNSKGRVLSGRVDSTGQPVDDDDPHKLTYLNRQPSSFGSLKVRGSRNGIPTFGKYAYAVDPALNTQKGASMFGMLRRNRSSFGYRIPSVRPSFGYRGPSFGRINYGFSRYF